MGKPNQNWLYLLLLVLSGEAIFILPFVLTRIFRPTVMDAFELSNVELGLCFSIYGIVAMISYLLGGPLADKYAPRKLIAMALWLTALGGLVYAQFPQLWVLQIVYGWWGFTTIFLFWAPMIKATRLWGGATLQGRAFSFLDGGRGLTGALFGLLGVLIFSVMLPGSPEDIGPMVKKKAFAQVIHSTSFLISIIGVLVWRYMKHITIEEEKAQEKIKWVEIKQLLRLRSVWLLMVIICCGYVGYKITDVISLYAEEVMGQNQVESAKTGTFLQFLRPITGIALGVFADRFKLTKILIFGFAVCIIGGLLFACGLVVANKTILFFMAVFTVGIGVYACRALYFSILRLGNIPLALTGTAVGLISLVGYTPDIFAGPLYGYFLDTYPGIKGHQIVFMMLSLFSLTGGLAAYLYDRKYAKLR